jgi:FMN-dependent NADH-azoreductase
MKNILHIISSPRGADSVSIKLGNAIVEKLQNEYPGSNVNEVNLGKHPFPHLDEIQIQALRTPQDNRTTAHFELLKQSDEAIKDLTEADIVVIGLPLYNFGITSSLKTWLDNVVRAGVTFSYSENGPKGLLSDKKVYVAMASGGIYSDGPMQPLDYATPYLNTILGFIGLTDVSIIRAEGFAIPALQETALDKAIESIIV